MRPVMAHVVFLRAANVGGRNVFRPAQLVLALEHLDAVNIGAAGTFVVRRRASASAIKAEFLKRLEFEPGIAIFPAEEVLELVARKPFDGVKVSKEQRNWAAALCSAPRTKLAAPIEQPAGARWSVRFESVAGRVALGRFRRQPKGYVFPNQVVEKALGVPATTRWWETWERVAAVLNKKR
jgi:uncharacterized protein (DUF1697 family)